MTAENLLKIGAILIITLLLNIFQLSFSQGFGQTPKKDKPAPTPGPPKPPTLSTSLKVGITSPQTEVVIGDWIRIDLTITNTTTADMRVIKPTIDIDSVSFLIKNIPLNPQEKEWGFTYSIITPSVYEHKKDNMEKITILAGATSKTNFKIPALALASWQIKASYQGGPEIVSSEPLDIKIVPPKSEKPDEVIKDGELIATIETSKGDMSCRFFFRDAPNTVLSFVRLAKESFYDNLIFHRIIKDFMIQGGDPKGTGNGGPGYSIKAEFNKNKHIKGVLSMARSSQDPPTPLDNDSAGSQFFICHGSPSHLDGKYTAFGQLLEGISVLDAIGSVKTGANNRPVQNVTIKKISIVFKAKK